MWDKNIMSGRERVKLINGDGNEKKGILVDFDLIMPKEPLKRFHPN